MAATKSPPPSLGLKDIYLIFYNAACALGWAYVLVLGIPSFFNSVASSDASLVDALKNAGSDMYFATPATAGWSDEAAPSLATVLTIVQSAAILEIVHAALGLVRSPVFVTTMQVGSRIVALHMVNASPKAQSKSLSILLDVIYNVKYVACNSDTDSLLLKHNVNNNYVSFFCHCSSVGSSTYDPILGPRRSPPLPLLRDCHHQWRCYKGNTLPPLLASLLTLCCTLPIWHLW